MGKGWRTVQVNTYLAILAVTIVGSGAVLLITNVANKAADQADAVASQYTTVSAQN